jgi:hypothetical protein
VNSADLLTEAFGRIQELGHDVVDGLSVAELTFRLEGRANSVAWLVWHLTRIQDDHLAGAFGTEQVWMSQGWSERFGLPLKPSDTGYGHAPSEVEVVRADGALLTGYLDAVHERTAELLAGVSDSDLDRVVDERWDPPVTLGVRLVSVIGDDLQHLGQAAFVRGLLP